MDEIDIKCIRAKQYEVQQRYIETVSIIAKSLQMLGIHLPYGNKEAAIKELDKALSDITVNLRGRKIRDLINSEEMTERKHILAMQLLNTAHAPSFVIGELDVYVLISTTMVNLSLCYGNCEMSPVGYAYHGLCSAEHTNDYQSAYEFSKLSVELAERTSSIWKGRVLLYAAVGVTCFFQSYKVCLDTFRMSAEKSLEYCDYAIACYCYSYMPFAHGLYDELNSAFATHQSSLNYLEKNNSFFYQVAKLPATWLEYLWTPEVSVNLVQSLVKHHSAPQVPDASAPMLVATYDLGRLATAYYRGDKDQWLQLADQCDVSLMKGVRHLIFVPIGLFFIALVYLSSDYNDDTIKEQRIKRAEEIIVKFELWARLNPENFKHRYLILVAQHHRIRGEIIQATQCFERAAKSASEFSLPLIQAMAHELSAEMWSSIGICRAEFRDCVARAAYLYNAAGAVRKVDMIKKKYGPQLLPELEVSMPRVLLCLGEFLSRSRRSVDKKAELEEPFDIMAVMMASKAMSTEMSLDQFLNRMMQIILQYAGASRGVYIQAMEGSDHDDMTVVAEGSIDNIQVDALRVVPLQDYENVPRGLVYYVMRVKEPVVIGSSSSNLQFFKEIQGNVRSALCFPVIRSNDCRGVLYLENNAIEDAFSDRHAEIMSILTGQVSMALENARLAALLESERRFRTITLQLEQAKKRLEEFIDILCHELRNPLNVICGNNEILNELVNHLHQIEGDNYDDDFHNCVQEFEESLQTTDIAYGQLKDIIDTVLTVSMLENKSIKLQSILFEPKEIVEKVSKMFTEKAKEKKLMLDYQVKVSEKASHVIGDPHRLQEMLINLLSNAIKFTSASGGKVLISCVEKQIVENKVSLLFSVEDTGCGLTDREIGKILTPNAAPSTFRLGLRISKELCELMGGSLTIASTLGEGAIFSFTLVFDIGQVVHQETSVPTTTPVETVYRVLVVDDNVINQKILCRLLRTRGYHCDVASNGVEALQVLTMAQYDIVLMDIEMPVMNGIDCTKRVREMESERHVKIPLPIVGVSGNSRDEILSVVMDAGMQGYVTKPYMSTEIYTTVERLLSCTV
jgi:signal transduction histidine kinase/CheY-like chemotaxis protein/tetratricopeptide (TPR) repeat protein